MRRFLRPLFLLSILLPPLAGCGGGLKEGMSDSAGQITPERQKELDDLAAQEEAAARSQGKRQ